jgi:hypothetical protein
MNDTGEMPPVLESMIAAERSAPSGNVAVRDDILDRLVTTHAGAGLLGGSTATSTTSAVAAVALKFTVVALIAAGAFGAGVWVGGEHRRVVEVVPIRVPVPDDQAPSRPGATVVQGPETPESPTVAKHDSAQSPAAPNQRRSSATSRDVQPEQVESTATPAERESQLLREAWSAYEGGDYERALSTIDRHVEAFASGYLAEERDALRVRVLIGAGSYAAAREQARRFFADYPTSIHGLAVERALASIP